MRVHNTLLTKFAPNLIEIITVSFEKLYDTDCIIQETWLIFVVTCSELVVISCNRLYYINRCHLNNLSVCYNKSLSIEPLLLISMIQ